MNGVALDQTILRGLGEVRVQERLSLPTLCEMIFRDPPGPLTAIELLVPGAIVRIRIQGYMTPLFEGDITAIELVYAPDGAQELRIRGYDVLHRLRQQRTTKTHSGVTLSSLLSEFGEGWLIKGEVDSPRHHRIIQHEQSDFDLVAKIAEDSGIYFTLHQHTLELFDLNGLDMIPHRLVPGETLLDATFELNSVPETEQVTVSGWDAEQVLWYSGQAMETPDTLPHSFPASVDRVDRIAPNADYLDLLAKAEISRLNALARTMQGTIQGFPDIRPGHIVQVQGTVETFAGSYTLTAVDHILNAELGYVAEISSIPPAPRSHSRVSSATLGVVIDITDPLHLGRVRVQLPAYSNTETEWLGVLSAGAGKGKGLTILPDIDDQVLVMLPHGDPAYGVVLGGLYGINGMHDDGINDNSVRRFGLLTLGGQRIQLDDSGHLIRLENDDGSYVELAPGKMRVHAATDLDIEAPGHRVTIRGHKINFEQD